MVFQWLLAALHLLALGIGLGAICVRAWTLGGPLDQDGVRRALVADTFWGIAALLWIVTGLTRAFGGFDKGSTYYLHNSVFALKMLFLIAILVLEVWPMMTLIKWRDELRRQQPPDTSPARNISRISWVQAGLIVLMVLAATAMARGYGAGAW